MSEEFFKNPILNSPYEYPSRYGELNSEGQPTQQIIESRRIADDGHGSEDPLHLIVEIKGYRKEDAKEKKSTMDTYWIPGVRTTKAPSAAGPSPSSPTSTRCRTTLKKRSQVNSMR